MTRIGTVDVPSRAVVDRHGLFTPAPDGWSLDWWVGAEDRWHVPSRETAVRQGLVGGSPIVETLMRVPGGDVASTSYVVAGSEPGHAVGMMEIHNRAAVPVAVGFVVRPAHDIAIDGTTVTVDGRPALTLPRAPSRVAWSESGIGDLLAPIDADAAPTHSVHSAEGRAQAAFVFPLSHTSSCRVAVALSPSPSALSSSLDLLPPLGAVTKGWDALGDRGLRADLPAGRFADAFTATRRRLLLALPPDATVADRIRSATALDECGYGPEAAGVLVALGDHQHRRGRLVDPTTTAALLVALAAHWRLTSDRETVEETLQMAARGANHLARSDGVFVEAFSAAADLFEAAGEDKAAARARSVTRSVAPDCDETVAADLDGLLEDCGPTFTWDDDIVRTPAFASAARRSLVRSVGDRRVAVCSRFPAEWEGQSLDVQDAPTRWGTVSFGVRWHGPRPALLWEVDGAGIVVSAPGLDPAWSADAAAGEALLGAARR